MIAAPFYHVKKAKVITFYRFLGVITGRKVITFIVFWSYHLGELWPDTNLRHSSGFHRIISSPIPRSPLHHYQHYPQSNIVKNKTMISWIRCFLLCCFLFPQTADSYGYPATVQSLQPLQYITPSVLGGAVINQVLEVKDGLIEATLAAFLPVNQEDALAIFVSEGVSGSLGGLAGQVVSLIDGNKNKKQTGFGGAAGTYGAYFGVAGAVRSLASLSGFSDVAVSLTGNCQYSQHSPSATFIGFYCNMQCRFFFFTFSQSNNTNIFLPHSYPPAFALATIVSELIKIRSKTIQSQQTRASPNGPTMFELMKVIDNTLITTTNTTITAITVPSYSTTSSTIKTLSIHPLI